MPNTRATNAFAQPLDTLPNNHILRSIPLSNPDDSVTKRRKVSAEDVEIFSRQTADQEAALEVDHTMLDYLAYQSIQGCLDKRKKPSKRRNNSSSSNSEVENDLQLINAFLHIFKTRHPCYKPDPELRFRLMLLRFVTLFTHRLFRNTTTPNPSDLEDLRLRNQQRAKAWIATPERLPTASFDTDAFDNDLPIPQTDLERNRVRVLQGLGAKLKMEDYEDAYYGTSHGVALLDLVPLFVEVSAAIHHITGGRTQEPWMSLAVEFMLQACLEQYLVYGAAGSDAVDEAFAHGYKRADAALQGTIDGAEDAHGSEGADDIIEIDDMFEHEKWASEVEGWTAAKRACMEELMLHAGRDQLSTRLERLAEKHPMKAFEERVMEFLRALSKSIPKPVLVQLEEGQLHGMNTKETQTFLQSHGCSLEDLFGKISTR